jgi:3D (Asp-Asp-Asp) domain-containing protein
VRHELAAAHSTRAAAQQGLAQQLRVLYTRGEPDAIAILLGAGSLQEALAGIENLQFSAKQTQRVVRQAKTAQRRLATLKASLSRRTSDMEALAQAARDTHAALAQARAARAAYVVRLASERRLNAGEISSLEARASQATARSARVVGPSRALPVDAVASAPAPVSLQSDPVSSGARTLTVSSTGYALPGTTASGLPVGWGIVAVDPSVIPLGTKMTIPGYGEGVAADTGSAVQGLTIDLWFPTTAQALEWGRRTVTITLH